MWEVEDGEEERRGMEGEGSGLFMDGTEGGWVSVNRKLPGWTNWQQPRPRRDRDVNKAMPFRVAHFTQIRMSLGMSSHLHVLQCLSMILYRFALFT